MSKRNSDGDILTNRVSLGLAKNQKLLASWMGPQTDSTPSNNRPIDDHDEEDMKQSGFGHDTLGVGGILPKDIEDGSFIKRAPTSNDKLLAQLIGKKKAKAHMASKQQATRPGFQQQQQRYGRPTAVQKDESEEEDEGRAAVFKSKKRRLAKAVKHDSSESEDDLATKIVDGPVVDEPVLDDEEHEEEVINAPPVQGVDVGGKEPTRKPKEMPSRSKAKPMSYLDELLAKKSKKQKKKKGKDKTLVDG